MPRQKTTKKNTPKRSIKGFDGPPEIADYTSRIVGAALAEDIGSGDVTTLLTVPARKRGRATIVACEPLVVAGLFVAKEVFSQVDPRLRFSPASGEGHECKKGEVIATIEGSLASILTAERVVLNFIQRLSGIATLSRKYVKKTTNLGVAIYDTRKTTPSLRILEKYAVKVGGCENHRMGLYDAVLIKDNHIAAAGSMAAALDRVRASLGESMVVEVEARTLAEVREALSTGILTCSDIILLDNMSPDKIKKAVDMIDARTLTEASGGITLETVAAYARTGVDRISVGGLTHSAPAADLSLRVIK